MKKRLGSEFVNWSISWGTLRPEDVIPEMMFLLEEYDPEAASRITAIYIDVGWPYSQAGLAFGQFNDLQNEFAMELWEDLERALDGIAPDGTYFGAHPGDGSDFGFWENEEDYD